jgi:hypothetical protein
MLSATRFFMLFQLLLFASVIASITNSDLLGRDETTILRVTPTDPRNATKIAEIDALLRKQYGDAEVHPILEKNGLPAWLITSTQDDIVASLELIDGVSVTTNPQASITKREGGGGPRASDLAGPAVTKCIVLAKDSADLDKTKAFLKTLAEHGNDIYDIGYKGHARGWGNVTLTEDAVKKVEGHDGVAAVRPEHPVIDLLVLPKGDRLASRDTTWQKQDDADLSLLMDSQYR